MKRKYIIFNICSIVLFTSLFGFYLYRFIHFKSNGKIKEYSNNLSERIKEEYNRFYLISEIEKINDTYYFINFTRNNYVNYKGLIWRIIKIDNDKNITIILDDSINNMPYYTINNWLNKTNEEHSGIFSNLIDMDNIALLSINDYNCAGGENSYLNNKTDYWIENGKYIDNTGYINNTDNNNHNIRPVITLPSDTIIDYGNGSIDNPFVIGENKIDTLNKIQANSYLEYNNSLWRVINVYDDKIKLVSEELINNEDNKPLEYIFSYKNNSINILNKNSLLYYLNNEYIESLENNDYLTEGTFYIGKYIDNDYSSIYEDEINMKVGLLTVADPYVNSINNTFTLTSNINSNINIYIIQNNKLYETLISEKAYIRPVIYMKNNITIKSGNGTYNEPYILGGLIDEENE